MTSHSPSPLSHVAGCIAVVALLLSAASAFAQDASDSADAADHDALARAIEVTTIDLDYDEAELADVIADIAARSGITIALDPKLIDDVGEEEITLTLRGLTVRNALEVVLEFVELTFTFRYGMVFITTPETAYAGDTIMRIYDVRDITAKIKNFPGARIRLRSDESGRPGIEIEDEDPIPEPPTADDLEDLIPDAIAPDSWKENPEAMIMIVGGMLVVRQTADVHAQIARFLSQLRENK